MKRPLLILLLSNLFFLFSIKNAWAQNPPSVTKNQSPLIQETTVSVIFNEAELREKMRKEGLSEPVINKLIEGRKKLEAQGRRIVWKSYSKLGANPLPTSTCSDLGVENGWGAWMGATGSNSGGNPGTIGTPTVPVSPQFNLTSGNGIDPCTPGINVSDPKIPVVAPGFGNSSIQLGEPQVTGCMVEQLTYQFTVTASDTNLIYAYALVFYDPSSGHAPSESPFADFLILDSNGDTIPCSYQHNSSSAGLSGYYQANSSCLGGPSTYYRPWTKKGINLGAYLGQTVTIVITNADCVFCGHFAHSYWDFSCGLGVTKPEFCTGQSLVLCALDTSAGTTFQWFKNGILMPVDTTGCITVYPVLGDTFTVITNQSSSCNINPVYIPNDTCKTNVYVVTSVSGNAICSNVCNGQASANATGGFPPYTYTWNTIPVQTTNIATGLCAGTYTITVSDSLGTIGIDTATIINMALPQQPVVCMVTVDSLSKSNVIMWDKTPFTNSVDSFIIYREISTNNYQPIAAVSFDSLSLFIDTVRTLYFPNTGDPNAGTYRYKIAVRDTCDQLSLLSLYHNTIFITNNNGSFTWTQHYTIEGSANPVNSYVLMRDDSTNGNWHAINSVAGTQQSVTDPAYAAWQSTASWRVQTLWNITCTPSIKNPLQTFSYVSSYSNVKSVNTLGVDESQLNDLLHVYPNPTSGELTLNFWNSNFNLVEVSINSVLGSEIYKISTPASGLQIIDISGLSEGIYFLKLRTEMGIVSRKVVLIK